MNATVRRSRAVRNQNGGLMVYSASGAATTLTATGNVVSHNATGIGARFPGSKVIASANVVTHNSFVGLFNNNQGLFESGADNSVHDNTTDTSGPLSLVFLQ